jgi:hypothetical protein
MRRLVAEVVRPSSKPAEVLRDSAAYCLDLREVDMITASGWQPMYARRADHMKASEIRELLKLLERPGIISFAGGIPDPELLCTLTRPASNTVPTSARGNSVIPSPALTQPKITSSNLARPPLSFDRLALTAGAKLGPSENPCRVSSRSCSRSENRQTQTRGLWNDVREDEDDVVSCQAFAAADD